MRRRILVTGGAGFIGSAFVRKYAGKYDIVVLDNLDYSADLERLREVEDEFRFIEGDVRDPSLISRVFEEEHPDVVVHFAAQTHVDRSIFFPSDFYSTNVMGTLNLLLAAIKSGIDKFIHISTDEVYGEIPPGEERKFSEEDPLRPSSPYSSSKASADLMVQSFVRTYSLPAVIARPSNCYGPWQYPEKLIPYSILRLIRGERITLYGDGSNVRTWLHVYDCVRAIDLLIERGETGEIYNIGSLEERSNREIARLILGEMNLDDTFVEYVADRPGHDFRYALNIDKIRGLGWEPEIHVEEGIKETVNWFLKHRDWLLAKYSQVEEFAKTFRSSALKFIGKHK